MRAVLGRIAALIRICLSGRNGKLGGIVFLVVLGLELSAIYLSILLVTWSKDFFDALEQLDADAAVWQIGVFAVLIGLSAGQFLLAQYLRKFVEITWRRTLTDAALDQWVGGKAYWYMRPGFSAEAIDNPDQRIADDCRLFLKGLLTEALDLIPAIVGLFSYVVLLWSLSTFPLEFTLFGIEVAIPRYMVWLSFIYVFVSSVITHRLGRPLKDLYFNQQKAEANLRYDLVRTREHATEIGMLGGEAAERRGIDRSFDGVATNWWRLMNRELILGLFTRPYFQTVLRIPIFFALPAYLAGAITFGGLMQLASAFSRVTNTLSWFLFSYKDLAEFVATSERLGGFFEATRAPTPSPDAPRDLVWRDSRDGALRLRGVNLVTPAGRRLAPVADLVIQPGERIWLAGDSGSGKSSLIAAMAGLWPYGEGQVETPAAERMFLPQKPYLPMTGLAEAAVYPADPAAMKPGEIERLIRDVGLAHRLPALSAEGATAVEGLSGGERQRLALARVLVASPDWIFLDEATSALDEKAEQELFALLLRRHPKATFVVAAHRPPVALSPYRRIDIAHPFPAIEMAIA